jgi:hypothetical protein
MKHCVAKFHTHRAAEEATREYYRRLSPEERLEVLFALRARSHKERDDLSGRLERVYRIVQLKQG